MILQALLTKILNCKNTSIAVTLVLLTFRSSIRDYSFHYAVGKLPPVVEAKKVVQACARLKTKKSPFVDPKYVAF